MGIYVILKLGDRVMIEIRKAYATDAYMLVQISDYVWKSEFYDVLPNGILSERLRRVNERVKHLQDQIKENNRILVALDDNKIIGFIFYAKSSDSVDNISAEIREIYVIPEYQRKGVGTKLFQDSLVELKRMGYRSLIVACPLESTCIQFFSKMGGSKREVVVRNLDGYSIRFDLMNFDLENMGNQALVNEDWNRMFSYAQDHLMLLNEVNREIAVLLAESGKMYLGLGIKNRVCPIESALSNMYLGEDSKVTKILILDRKCRLVLPCGKCRDLLIGLGQEKALILFELEELKTMTMKELNPYYKSEEKA